MLAAPLLAAGAVAAPFLVCGGLKIVYDLALWRAFRHRPPPEERSPGGQNHRDKGRAAV